MRQSKLWSGVEYLSLKVVKFSVISAKNFNCVAVLRGSQSASSVSQPCRLRSNISPIYHKIIEVLPFNLNSRYSATVRTRNSTLGKMATEIGDEAWKKVSACSIEAGTSHGTENVPSSSTSTTLLFCYWTVMPLCSSRCGNFARTTALSEDSY